MNEKESLNVNLFVNEKLLQLLQKSSNPTEDQSLYVTKVYIIRKKIFCMDL